MLCGNFIMKDFPVMLYFYFYFYIKNVGCRLTVYGRYPNIYYRTNILLDKFQKVQHNAVFLIR
jgi:hypothetical protein